MTEEQRLLLKIEKKLQEMTEKEKQEVLTFLWGASSCACKEERHAV